MQQLIKETMQQDGFAVINDVYTKEETNDILQIISQVNTSGPAFRKTDELFAIRRFLKAAPEAAAVIFSPKLTALIEDIFGKGYFVVKSIYFDKPPQSNWFVASHQDLTISVNKKLPVEGFGLWTVKQDQYAVQPPVDILEDIFTIRIHLDDTNECNGALKVIPGSHANGILKPGTFDNPSSKQVSCCVKEGGIMLMKPLLLHSSGRTTNNKARRVIHLEFSKLELPGGLTWAEQLYPETVVSQ
ncbi:phytanoyl-CoA dioxygenase family protein [Chitinophagaceae bacterium MMS25-I14]